MGNASPLNFETIYPYLCENSLRESPLLESLRKLTAELPNAQMQVPPEQGQLLSFLTKLIGAQRAIEIGTFTGYSSICIAECLPDNGQLICCDISEEYTETAKRFWQRAGVADKIDLHIAPATDTLKQLIEDRQDESFDLVFIDADKPNYHTYYELSLALIKTNGLIIFDNMLWGGKVANNLEQDDNTVALRKMNQFLHTDSRVDISLLTVADGITLVRKR